MAHAREATQVSPKLLELHDGTVRARLNIVYAWQWNVYLEELMLAWLAVPRAEALRAHRPQEQSCDEYEYPISLVARPLFVGI
jgi:hypothetical protein